MIRMASAQKFLLKRTPPKSQGSRPIRFKSFMDLSGSGPEKMTMEKKFL